MFAGFCWLAPFVSSGQAASCGDEACDGIVASSSAARDAPAKRITVSADRIRMAVVWIVREGDHSMFGEKLDGRPDKAAVVGAYLQYGGVVAGGLGYSVIRLGVEAQSTQQHFYKSSIWPRARGSADCYDNMGAAGVLTADRARDGVWGMDMGFERREQQTCPTQPPPQPAASCIRMQLCAEPKLVGAVPL